MSTELTTIHDDLREIHVCLYDAIAEFILDVEQSLQAARRLTRPPLALGQNIAGDPEKETGAFHLYKLAKMRRGFDGNTAAYLLRLQEGQATPEIRWGMLSRAEKARAKRLWNWIGETHGLKSTPQGRPPVMDTALVLYCMCILSEFSGRRRFRYRRPKEGGAPGGPMWRALVAALPLAQIFLALRFRTTVNIPDEIAGPVRQFCRNFKCVGDVTVVTHSTGKFAANITDIVKLSRSPQFKESCRDLHLRFDSDDIALKPSAFRYAIFHTRKVLTAAQRSRAARKMRP
jgi:hypothetical protein